MSAGIRREREGESCATDASAYIGIYMYVHAYIYKSEECTPGRMQLLPMAVSIFGHIDSHTLRETSE